MTGVAGNPETGTAAEVLDECNHLAKVEWFHRAQRAEAAMLAAIEALGYIRDGDAPPLAEHLVDIAKDAAEETREWSEAAAFTASELEKAQAAYDAMKSDCRRAEAALAEVRKRLESSPDNVEYLCEVMHDAYEREAVAAGWATQEASRKPWADVPAANKATMRAAVYELLAAALGSSEEVKDDAG